MLTDKAKELIKTLVKADEELHKEIRTLELMSKYLSNFSAEHEKVKAQIKIKCKEVNDILEQLKIK